jgi:HptB-dependent secretion and biofilm anti anti-sigma factor
MNSASVTCRQAAADCTVISIHGSFAFSVYRQFRRACEGASAQHRFVVDLADADYMDSSALGMLLFLREQAGGEAARIEIANCNSVVRRILSIANFDKLFSIR